MTSPLRDWIDILSHLRITLKELSAEQLAEWLTMIERYTENVVNWTATDDTRRPGYREAKTQRAEPEGSSVVRSMAPQRVEEAAGTAWHGDLHTMSPAPDLSDKKRLDILDRPSFDNQNKTATPEQDI